MSSNFIELRVDTDKPQAIKDVLVEAKVDGGCHTWDGTSLKSERGIDRNARFPHIVADLLKLPWKVQGEVAVPFSNVSALNKKENWGKARFYAFKMIEWDNQSADGSNPLENRKLLETAQKQFGSTLRVPFKFKDFQTGWAHVVKHNLEGLVMKEIHGSKTYKIKKMTEEKLPVIGFIPGSVKGCFQIERKGVTGGVSALSVAYVQQYKDMLAKGLAPYVEIEYLYLTDNGVPFQPRLRRMATLTELQTT